jgi:hypothetical protein
MASHHPGGEPRHAVVDAQREITMTTGTEALVRRAYHFAEGEDFTSAVAASAPE